MTPYAHTERSGPVTLTSGPSAGFPCLWSETHIPIRPRLLQNVPTSPRPHLHLSATLGNSVPTARSLSDTPALPASRLLLWELLCLELPDTCRSSPLSAFTPRLKCRLLREAFRGYCPVHSLHRHPASCPSWFFSISNVCHHLVDLFLVCTPGWDVMSRRAFLDLHWVPECQNCVQLTVVTRRILAEWTNE